MTHGQQHCY